MRITFTKTVSTQTTGVGNTVTKTVSTQMTIQEGHSYGPTVRKMGQLGMPTVYMETRL